MNGMVSRRQFVSGSIAAGLSLGLLACSSQGGGDSEPIPGSLGASNLQDVKDALAKELVETSRADEDAEREVLSTEMRTWLRGVVERSGGDAAYFDEKVTDYECTLLRGDTVMMCYYAAVATGQDSHNADFDVTRADVDPDWLDPMELHLVDLFPSFAEQQESLTLQGEEIVYDRELDAANDWIFWHAGATGKQVIEYDTEAGSMRALDPITLEEAVAAVGRLADGVE